MYTICVWKFLCKTGKGRNLIHRYGFVSPLAILSDVFFRGREFALCILILFWGFCVKRERGKVLLRMSNTVQCMQAGYFFEKVNCKSLSLLRFV